MVKGVVSRGVDRSLRFVQSRRIFRVIGRRVIWGIAFSAASPSDLEIVHSKLNPGVPYPPSSPDSAVTRFVATRQGRVIGFVELVRHPLDDAPYIGHWLFSLNVLDPKYRGFGIGETLARRVIQTARDEGGGDLWLIVGETNLPAIHLYRKLGFVRAPVGGLEEQLLEEARISGRRRITMVNRFHE